MQLDCELTAISVNVGGTAFENNLIDMDSKNIIKAKMIIKNDKCPSVLFLFFVYLFVIYN